MPANCDQENKFLDSGSSSLWEPGFFDTTAARILTSAVTNFQSDRYFIAAEVVAATTEQIDKRGDISSRQ